MQSGDGDGQNGGSEFVRSASLAKQRQQRQWRAKLDWDQKNQPWHFLAHHNRLDGLGPVMLTLSILGFHVALPLLCHLSSFKLHLLLHIVEATAAPEASMSVIFAHLTASASRFGDFIFLLTPLGLWFINFDALIHPQIFGSEPQHLT